MSNILNKIIPNYLLNLYRFSRYKFNQIKDKNKSTESVFTEIYKQNKWGGTKNEFCSGGGSVDKDIVDPYITKITEIAIIEKFTGMNFVDLGCGDFRVGKQLIPLCYKYIGVDIVKSLIDYNQEKYGNEDTQFKYLNIIEDELPEGDVCFIRQVLQHLSNKQILLILNKLKKYKWVFITEHYPTDNNKIIPNKDKAQGMDIRLNENSGIYLTEYPFNISNERIHLILEVPSGIIWDERNDQGVIRTFLYKPQELK